MADFARCRRLNGSSGSDDVICVSLLNVHIQSQDSTAAGQWERTFRYGRVTSNIYDRVAVGEGGIGILCCALKYYAALTVHSNLL